MPTTDRRDEPEDSLELGSERWSRLEARYRRHVPRQLAVPVVAVLIVLAAVVTLTRHGPTSGHPSARPSSSQRSVPAPAVAASSQGLSEYSSLYTVPAEDLRGFLRTRACRRGCVANNLAGPALSHAVASFRGLNPLAGGTVTRHGTVIFETVEALAHPDALVHLVLRRSDGVPASGPALRQRSNGSSSTIIVGQARAGWLLTAWLVFRADAPPTAAALHWSTTTRLPS